MCDSDLVPFRLRVEELYERNRFFDAWALINARWRELPDPEALDLDALLLAARLAGRLGGGKLRRHLLRLAVRRAPTDPRMVCYGLDTRRYGPGILELLSKIEEIPRLEGADPRMQAVWMVTQACTWAWVRDFARAHRALGEARALGEEAAYVAACEADVLLREDRWREAGEAAMRAWTLSPGMPGAAEVLARVLARLGRGTEATELVTCEAENEQSFEVMLVAVWLGCAEAERRTGSERRKLGERAWHLAERARAVAPLADRDAESRIVCALIDAAMALGEPERMAALEGQITSPFFRSVVAHLREHGPGRERLLAYRPVMQKHDTCLPASIAAVLGVFDVQLDEDAMAAALTYDGTAIWRAIDWLEREGFAVKAFVATPALAHNLLTSGLPFVLSFEDWGSAHAVAAVGLDDATGTLIVHDPSAERWGRVLLARLGEDEAPFGPLGLAVVPADRRALLAAIPQDVSAGCMAVAAFEKARETRGILAAGEIADELAASRPDDAHTRRLAGIRLGLIGNVPDAIAVQSALVEEYPAAMGARRDLLSTLYRARDTARLREVLGDVVERGVLPGSSERQDWVYPPPMLVAQWADVVGRNHDGARRAERELRSAIRRAPGFAMLFHILGDLLEWDERSREATLPHRVAATLDAADEHYAQAACDALRLAGDEEAGLALLRGRVEELGTRVKGGAAWMTLVGALEAYGQPEEAGAVLDQALAARPHDAELAGFAVSFWVRMGQWERAKTGLDAIAVHARRAVFLSANVHYLRAAGFWEQAVEPCQAWLREEPDDLGARRVYLDLIARRDGRRAAVAVARAWTGEQPDNEDLEYLLYETLNAAHFRQDAVALIRRRVERNSFDAWAWREVGHALVDAAECVRPERRKPLWPELDEVLERCRRLSPGSPGTLELLARASVTQGDRETAVELLLAALDADPAFEMCYRQVCELAEAWPEARRQSVLAALEERLLRTTGQLACARSLALAIANTAGVREAERWVARWRARRPHDPEVIEAQVDLWLMRGEGRSDAQRAAEVLEAELERFPHHLDLALSLAHAYAVLGRTDEERAVYEEIIRQQPGAVMARRLLAALLAREGLAQDALRVLEDTVRAEPLTGEAWLGLAGQQWELGQHQAALATLEQAVARAPEDLSIRAELVDRLIQLGEPVRALAVAREGLAIYPEGAYCHFLVARALGECGNRAEVAEIEWELRRSLELNRGLFDAADMLAELLASQERYADARRVMEEILPLLADSSPGRGRLAWITWSENRREAAVDEIVAVVQDSPRYLWGWWNLMRWLEAGQMWDRARAVLGEVPAVLLGSAAFRAQRLDLLARAGVTSAELDPEWERLLADFPDDVEVRKCRFDVLVEGGDWDRAAAVLNRLEHEAPEPPALTARRVRLLAHRRLASEALAAAAVLWERPEDGDTWEEETTWKALLDAGLGSEAIAATVDFVTSGRRLRRRTFELAVEAIADVNANHKVASSKKRALALLDKLLAALVAQDHGGQRIEAVLSALTELGQTDRVLRFWREHRDLCRRLTPVWACLGWVLANAGSAWSGELYSWLADWREHPDAPAWALANFSLSMKQGNGVLRNDRLEELLAVGSWALELRLDQTARFHACVVAEALLRLHRDDEMLDHMQRWGGLVRDTSERWWLPGPSTVVASVLPAFESLVACANASDAARLTRGLHTVIDKATPSWVVREWSRRLGRLMPWPRRNLLTLGLYLRRLLSATHGR